MEIDIQLADCKEPQTAQAVWDILCACSNEFVPPLSDRKSTSTHEPFTHKPSDEASEAKPTRYFETMQTQALLCASVDGEIAGFASFKPKVEIESIKAYAPCNYLSTICVAHGHRRKGIARKLYGALLNELPEALQANHTATRTWSTNTDHLALLNTLNFEVKTVKHSERGENIDTLYLVHTAHP